MQFQLSNYYRGRFTDSSSIAPLRLTFGSPYVIRGYTDNRSSLAPSVKSGLTQIHNFHSPNIISPKFKAAALHHVERRTSGSQEPPQRLGRLA